MHFQVKNSLKNKSNHSHTTTKYFIYFFFYTHKPQPYFLPNIYINPTNHIKSYFLKNYFFQTTIIKIISINALCYVHTSLPLIRRSCFFVV